jgi:outer membrane protein
MRRDLLILTLAAAPLCAQGPMKLTLAEAQRLAIQNNPRFSSARFSAAAAHQMPNEFRSAYQPSLSASFTSVGADNGTRLAAGGLNNPVVYNRVGSGLLVNQLITDFGRTSNLVAMANLRAQAEDQATEIARADILLATSQAYYAVLRSEALLKVADQTVSERQLVSDQVTSLANSKLKSTLDVSFANVNLEDAKLMQVQAQNDVQAAEAQLAEAMGLPNQTAFDLSEEPTPQIMTDRVSDLIQQAIQNRPELKNLQYRQNAAQHYAQAEHDLFFPSIGVVGATGLVPTGVAAVPGRYGAIGLNVNIPIFNGGLYKARSSEARLEAQAAAQDVSAEQNRVVRDVRIAFLNATAAYDKIGVAQKLLDQAKMGLDLAQSRFDLGLGSIVELSLAQLNLTSAQIAYTGARYDYQAQRIDLDYQTGTLR